MRGLERVFVANAQLARQMLPDRVHPAAAGHWLMAEALLRAWHAPALVSEVELDASGRVVNSRPRNGDRRGGDAVRTHLDAAGRVPAAASELQ